VSIVEGKLPELCLGALVSPFTELFCIHLLFVIPVKVDIPLSSMLGLIKLAQLPGVLLLLCDYSC